MWFTLSLTGIAQNTSRLYEMVTLLSSFLTTTSSFTELHTSLQEFTTTRKTVTNAVHIHVNACGLHVMILIDGIYEEYVYRNWLEVFAAHPLTLSTKMPATVFVRG